MPNVTDEWLNSVVRRNLMTVPNYTPYCGNGQCQLHMPRLRWDGEQFKCFCGYRTNFPTEFINAYKATWRK